MLGDSRRREEGARETASRKRGRWLALLLLLISCPGGLYVGGARSGDGGAASSWSRSTKT